MALSLVQLGVNAFHEDDFQFDLNWRGDLPGQDDLVKGGELLEMITSESNHRYKCTMPEEAKPEIHMDTTDNKEINTASLLNDIYSKKFCSYRIESYWIYELCHGQYVKQYHETKNTGKRSVTESYFLGKFNSEIQEPDYVLDNSGKRVPNVHWRNLDGNSVATYAVKYVDGTECEVLPNTFRQITVFYACMENGNDNIASFEETSSCFYEMVVVTKLICSHPAYKSPVLVPKSINCYAVEGAPVQPEELEDKEDSRAYNAEDNSIKMTDKEGETFIIHYGTSESNKADEATVFNTPPQSIQRENNMEVLASPKPNSIKREEKAMMEAFFKGDSCLTGGTGWWKFEICYGKHVIQFHEDENTKIRTTVLLGTWNQENHLEWTKKHKHKRPVKNPKDRSTVSLLYSEGQYCEGLDRNRFVEVKFRCLESTDKSHAVSLYLIEPLTCEYLLGVESPWFCSFVKLADENGVPTLVGVDENN